MGTKAMSLVEQKRMQWAKEREELAGLGALWGTSAYSEEYRSCIRTHYVSTMDLGQVQRNDNYPAFERITMLTRSPSLPPISRSSNEDDEGEPRETEYKEVPRHRSKRHNDNGRHSNEEGGETSGYNSDSNEWNQQDKWVKSQRSANDRPQRSGKTPKRTIKQSDWSASGHGFVSPESYTSSTWSNGDDANRLKWGDRGVGVGHLWEPAYHEPDCRLPQVEGMGNETPSWLERGLNKLDGSARGSPQVLVINHSAVTNEPTSETNRKQEHTSDENSVKSQDDRSYIRGQNVPVDPAIKLEREIKRQKALELQNAIRQQLEERDRKRKADIERRLKEEREEDDRIRKEREKEKQRYDEEQRKKKEKEEKEAQKANAMREALESADKLAREEKSRANRKHMLKNVVEFPKEIECNACITGNDTPPENNWYNDKLTSDEGSIPSASLKISDEKRDTMKIEHEYGHGVRNQNQKKERVLKPQVLNDIDQRFKDGLLIDTDPPIKNKDGLPNIVGNESKSVSLGEGTPILNELTNNRVLTPSKYRAAGRECATQTEGDIIIAARDARKKARKVKMKDREKSASLERTHQDLNLEYRYKRSQSQPRVSLQDRPKWGVNQPDTLYRKQSEKDPYYQQRLRKRQTNRAAMTPVDTGTDTESWTAHRQHNRHHYISDDYSRSPSPQPRAYTRKHRNQHRKKHSKHSKSTNIKDKYIIEKPVESPHLTPIESYDDEVFTPTPRIKSNRNKSDRLQTDDVNRNQPTSPSEKRRAPMMGETPNYLVKGKRLLNRRAESPLTIETNDKNVEQWGGDDNILSQLTLLRNGLLLKQQEWDDPRCHTSFSESSNYSHS